MTEERRHSTLRRQVNDLDWTDAGRGMAMWLIYRHAESIINHWDSLAILFVVIIAPNYIARIVKARWDGGQQQYKEPSPIPKGAPTIP